MADKDAEGRIKALVKQVSDLTGELNTSKAEVLAHSNRVDQLSGQIDILNSKVAFQTNAASEAQAAAKEAQDAFARVSADGTADALTKQVTELTGKLETQSVRFQTERAMYSAGLTPEQNPKGIRLALLDYGALPAEGRPPIGEYLKAPEQAWIHTADGVPKVVEVAANEDKPADTKAPEVKEPARPAPVADPAKGNDTPPLDSGAKLSVQDMRGMTAQEIGQKQFGVDLSDLFK